MPQLRIPRRLHIRIVFTKTELCIIKSNISFSHLPFCLRPVSCATNAPEPQKLHPQQTYYPLAGSDCTGFSHPLFPVYSARKPVREFFCHWVSALPLSVGIAPIISNGFLIEKGDSFVKKTLSPAKRERVPVLYILCDLFRRIFPRKI